MDNPLACEHNEILGDAFPDKNRRLGRVESRSTKRGFQALCIEIEGNMGQEGEQMQPRTVVPSWYLVPFVVKNFYYDIVKLNKKAERVGFEPTVARRPQRFSRPSHSTALAPLRTAAKLYLKS